LKCVVSIKLQLNYNWIATSYTIYMMKYNYYNSCNLSNNTHNIEYDELQMVIATQKLNCKVVAKHLFSHSDGLYNLTFLI